MSKQKVNLGVTLRCLLLLACAFSNFPVNKTYFFRGKKSMEDYFKGEICRSQ